MEALRGTVYRPKLAGSFCPPGLPFSCLPLSLITCLFCNLSVVSMPHETRRPPIASRDKDGREVLLIPLANTSLTARVFPEDYQRLLDAGWSSNWCWNCGVVKVPSYRTNVQRVARLIAEPQGDVQVRHRDRDPLNLRSDNLALKPFQRHPRPQGPTLH